MMSTMKWLDSITDSMHMNLSKHQNKWAKEHGALQPTSLQTVRHNLVTEQQQQ